MKALAKERSCRYETASELAGDVKRYLNDQHVLAGPPTTIYRLGKNLRRHRRSVVTAGTVLLLLLLGIGGTTSGMIRAKSALSKLMEELKDMAVLHAMNGDSKRMQIAINGAISAGASKGWARSIEAGPAMSEGDPVKALKLLREAQRLGEDTVSVHALLAQAHLYTDRPDQYMKEYAYLLRHDPKNFQVIPSMQGYRMSLKHFTLTEKTTHR